MSEPVGVALIGAGSWGRRLAAILRQMPALRLVTCFSRDAQKRDAFAHEFGCEAAPTFEAAIEHSAVQGVLIVTPNHVHAEQAIACAGRGKHIFVDKPIADTLADGQAIRAACESAGVTLMVGHCMRRLGAARRIKQLLDEGALGKIVLADANLSLPGVFGPEKWRFHRETCPGGPLMQLGIHHADTLLYWLGPAARVQGSFAHVATSAESDDVGAALVDFESGTRAALVSSYVSPRAFALRLFGSAANLHYEADMSLWGQSEHLDQGTRISLEAKDGRQDIEFEPRNMLEEELDEFARCVRGEMTPETGAAEGLTALEIIRGALESHETGKAYTIKGG